MNFFSAESTLYPGEKKNKHDHFIYIAQHISENNYFETSADNLSAVIVDASAPGGQMLQPLQMNSVTSLQDKV